MNDDPRYVEPAYLCAEHGYQADDYPCPACDDESRLAAVDADIERELSQAEAMSAVMDEMLRRIQRTEDEERGAALAQRFEGRGR